MYTSFFGFRAKPFNDKPELRFHYVTPGYAENFNAIRKSIRDLSGLHVLVGDPGSGKSLFLERLESASRNQDIHYLRIPNPEMSLAEMVDHVGEQLDLVGASMSTSEKLQWIQASLVENLEQRRLYVVAIDDAHKMADDVLADLLAFCDEQDTRALQLVDLGSPELRTKVERLNAQLNQEQAVIYQLQPLADEDIPNYITQQLRAAGYQGNTIFTPTAVERIVEHAQGSLRSLSLLCDASLVIAHLHSAHEVTPEIVDEAAKQHNIGSQEADAATTAAVPDEENDVETFIKNLAAEDEIEIELPIDDLDDETELPEELKLASGDSFLSHHLAIAAGLALLLCSGVIGFIFLSGDGTGELALSVPAETSTGTPAGVEIHIPDPAEPAADSPPQNAAEEPQETATAALPADVPQTETTAIEPPTQEPERVAITTPPRETFITDPDRFDSAHQQPPRPELRSQPEGIDIPHRGSSANPTAQALFSRAAEQIQAGQIIDPEGDNALETFLQILSIEPDNKVARLGLRQINKHYFEQVANARQTKKILYQQAEAARQQQLQYLNQIALAKQEKEEYLQDLSEYFVGQAIIANKYKVDSLIQAEIAQQNTQQYFQQLTGVLERRLRPPRQPTSRIESTQTAMLTDRQAVLAESRIGRLLARAEQQLADRKLVQPRRDCALNTFREILKLEPGHPEALAGTEYIMDVFLDSAAAAAAQGNASRAQYFYDQAMEIDPSNINLAQKVRAVKQQVSVVINATGRGPETGSVASSGNSKPLNLSNSPQLAEAILQSARLGDAKSVASILSSGATPDTADLRGNTALMIAAENGHIEVATHLIRRGAKVNRSNGFGETALMLAAQKGYADMIQYLLDSGASPHTRDADGRNALINATANGHADATRTLLTAGADPDTRSKSGRTALMAAAWGGHFRAVGLLLSNNANPDVKNADGWTALSHAAWQGNTNVVEALLRHGANPRIRNKNGQTPLMMASNRGHIAIVELLQ